MTPLDFRRRWAAAAARWNELEATSPGAAAAYLQALLVDGLTDTDDGLDSLSDEALLAAECALVRAAGEFDVDGYRAANPSVRPDEDVVLHFCREGWRGVRNPHAGFDVWWYTTEYLDPTAESVNPYVHYLLVGRHAGLQPLAVPTPRTPPTALADRTTGSRPRRVCLFAGYDVDGIVDDQVIAYLAELSRHADVYYLADGLLPRAELDRLRPVTRGAWSIPHGEYDFGSYARLARDLVGWEELSGYDEVLLVNDSCYLVRPLDDVFARMDATACDWWGLQLTAPLFTGDDGRTTVPLEEAKREFLPERVLTYHQFAHVGSYFLAFRAPVVADAGFRRRLDAVRAQASKLNVIFKYETGTTRYLVGQGFHVATYVPDLYPYHPAYGPWTFDLIADGFPLLKRGLIAENPFDVPDLARWRERLAAAAPQADVDAIERHLLRVSPADALARSLAVRTTPDGSIEVPPLLSRPEFRAADKAATQHDDWWAFAVRGVDGALAGGVRAVFDAVRDDPTITKVVLTGSRAISVSGSRVEAAPLRSEAGQRLLMRCRWVFVDDEGDVRWPLPPVRHRVIRVGGDVTLGEERWDVGVPAWDLLVGELPAELRADEERLLALLDGRRLALVVPALGSAPGQGEADRLTQWAEAEGLALGLREHPRDRLRWWGRALAAADPLDLGWRRFPELAIALRRAAVVLTDDPMVTAAAAAGGVRTLAPDGLDVLHPGGAPTIDGRAAQRLVQRVRAAGAAATTVPEAPVRRRSLADVWRRGRGR